MRGIRILVIILVLSILTTSVQVLSSCKNYLDNNNEYEEDDIIRVSDESSMIQHNEDQSEM